MTDCSRLGSAWQRSAGEAGEAVRLTTGGGRFSVWCALSATHPPGRPGTGLGSAVTAAGPGVGPTRPGAWLPWQVRHAGTELVRACGVNPAP
jgi:hypothetical protein